jgi:hypothetical protein
MKIRQVLDELENQFDREVNKHGQCGGFHANEFEDYVNSMSVFNLLNRLADIEQSLEQSLEVHLANSEVCDAKIFKKGISLTLANKKRKTSVSAKLNEQAYGTTGTTLQVGFT